MNRMLAQIESLPNLIQNQFIGLDNIIRNTFTHNEILSTKNILITGCGDSYFAGLAAELAIIKWCNVSVDVKSSLPAARYELPYGKQNFPNNPMVFGISVSGGVSRTIEAVKIANEIGGMTVAITANPHSKLAAVSKKMIDCSIPDFVDSPGVRSYQISLMALYLIGLHFAEVQGGMTMQDANKIRAELLATADVISSTIEKNKEKIRTLASQLKDEKNFHFISHGPNLATAVFSAAKIVESTGRYAIGQDTEEWAHLEYFNDVTSDVPTFVISPGYRNHALAAEFVSQMKRIGRNIIAVTPESDQLIAPLANHHLPVMGKVREELSPFVYMLAGELFAGYLAETIGEKYFRDGDARYKTEHDHRRTSIIELSDLE